MYLEENYGVRALFCPECGTEQVVEDTGYRMDGTRYMDGGLDERWVARLACGHLVEVFAYSRGYDEPRELNINVIGDRSERPEWCRI